MLACGHHSAQAWREAESADHCQDSEVPLVWHRLLVSRGLAGHGVGLFLLTVQFCDSVRPETSPRAQFHKASISALCPPPPPTPVEYFQILGCVLGSASAVVLFCTRRDALDVSTAGVSYRHLSWKQELSTYGQLLVGTLRRRNFNLSRQNEASQGSHQGWLTLGSQAGDLKQGNT